MLFKKASSACTCLARGLDRSCANPLKNAPYSYSRPHESSMVYRPETALFLSSKPFASSHLDRDFNDSRCDAWPMPFTPFRIIEMAN